MAEKHLKVFPLDIEKFIKYNELEEIDDPMFFAKTGTPTARGLLSNEIFGITKEDRTTIFAYIHLAGETFMHPLAYKIWTRLDPNVRLCAWEQGTFRLDKKTGRLVEDLDKGENGFKFLKKIINEVNFKKAASDKRNIRTKFLETYRDKLFIEDFAVIPAGYRDVDSADGKQVGVGEINKIYNAILRDCKALSEADDYGLTLNGSLRGRIQDHIVGIYNWICFGKDDTTGIEAQASGLSRKLGLIRRAGMKKSFDWGARLVICTQNLRKENLSDLQVDLDSIGLPLAAICANFYPYMLFHIRQWFDNNFSDVDTILAYDPKKNKTAPVHIKDWRELYSDERIKKELDRFMHGNANRFIAIEAPIEEEFGSKGYTPYLMFKGYMVDDKKYAEDLVNKVDIPEEGLKFPLQERPLTWCDLIYRAAMEIVKDKHTMITRFPVDSYWNQYPAKIKIISTINTETMIVNGHFYPQYPKIKLENINKNSSSMFVDVALPNNVRLDSIGGDFDGDTVSSKAIYAIEANDELEKAINSKRHYISLGGTNAMTTTKEGMQSLYDLTLVLPDDMDTLTSPKF